MTTILKICSKSDWTAACDKGTYKGSAVDLTDGFIHFSTTDQVQETAAKHFSGQEGLVLVAVDAATLGKDLKWEPSRNGDLFPHLYKDLSIEKVITVYDLPLNSNGIHLMPDDLNLTA